MAEPPPQLNSSASDQGPAEKLLPQVYDELRRLAAQRLLQEKAGVTWQATDLVNEAYLRLAGNNGQEWDNRGHFFAAAAEAMRRILVESARKRQTVKYGGDLTRQHVELQDIALQRKPEELLSVNDALDALAQTDPRAAELVKLRYFVGFTSDEAAKVLDISPRTAANIWAYARAWLQVKLDDDV